MLSQLLDYMILVPVPLIQGNCAIHVEGRGSPVDLVELAVGNQVEVIWQCGRLPVLPKHRSNYLYIIRD
jgi:hypothetical protein